MVRQSILAFIRNDLKTETKFYGLVMIIYGYKPLFPRYVGCNGTYRQICSSLISIPKHIAPTFIHEYYNNELQSSRSKSLWLIDLLVDVRGPNKILIDKDKSDSRPEKERFILQSRASRMNLQNLIHMY